MVASFLRIVENALQAIAQVAKSPIELFLSCPGRIPLLSPSLESITVCTTACVSAEACAAVRRNGLMVVKVLDPSLSPAFHDLSDDPTCSFTVESLSWTLTSPAPWHASYLCIA
jgi:hypothetical protein